MYISVILAGGEGTRMKSKYSKLSQTILNKPMIEYILEASENAGVEKNIIIVGQNKDYIQGLFKDRAIYKEQTIGEGIPYGTGYAVSLAIDEISDEDDVLILNGDCPLLRAESLREFLDFHKNNDYVGSLVSSVLEDPTNYGRIVRDEENHLKAIVEEKDASDEIKKIREINSGFYIFKGSHLKNCIGMLDSNNNQGEIYITDLIGILASQGEKLGVYTLKDQSEGLGINSKDQLSEVEEIMRARVNKAYMKEGVILENPSNIFIEPGVKIGRDTRISSGARIIGKSEIGEDCVIEGDTKIKDSILGDRVSVKSSYIDSSELGNDISVGPFAQLRPASNINDGVKIGNFVEVKASTMGEGSKAGHHAYIGDGDVGENVNIGCGVIFANYDGKEKHRSKIGDGSFIGSNATIISPVVLGEDVFVAADSAVTEDVQKGALYISRPKAHISENWTYKKRGEEND